MMENIKYRKELFSQIKNILSNELKFEKSNVLNKNILVLSSNIDNVDIIHLSPVRLINLLCKNNSHIDGKDISNYNLLSVNM